MTLQEKYRQLENNIEQKQAVDSQGTVVVVAGPGSGKTRIATIKAGIEVVRDKKVACISYSRVAANRMRAEFLTYDISEENISFGTVHGFCLYHIVHRYLHLYKKLLPEPWRSLHDNWHIATPRKIESEIAPLGIEVNEFKLKKARYTRYESVQFDAISDTNLRFYDQTMIDRGLMDFDMIAELSLIMVERIDSLTNSLSKHFDWIVIDEYQDLGSIFHRLVAYLSMHSEINFMIVGDPDQAIHDENGGNHINQLHDNLNFTSLKTKICYRYGQSIIDKSCQILNDNRSYIAHSTSYSRGDITCYSLKKSGEKRLAKFVATNLLPKIMKGGAHHSLGEIAILYPQRRNDQLADFIIEELRDLQSSNPDFGFVDEKGIRIPNTPLIEWIQDCADWCFSEVHTRSKTLQALSQYYERLYWETGYPLDENESRQCKALLRNVLLSLTSENLSCATWVAKLIANLKVEQLISIIGDPAGELIEVQDLLALSDYPATLLATRYNSNKVVVTTIHSAKGRQFKYVIVIGMQLGLIPWANMPDRIPYFRRLAYVACTRATHQTYLVTSPSIRHGISPFIVDIC